MAEVIFNFEGFNTIIQCDINDKMNNIIDKFLLKINKKEDVNKYNYLYNGGRIENELTFKEQANGFDINRKKMNIIVNTIDGNINKIKEMISKNIICPICKEDILMNIENFKIKLFGCKNNHVKNNII